MKELRIVLIVFAASVAAVAAAEDAPIAYRRIFVPADHLSAWPREGEKYLPVEVRDFEAWLARANQPANAAPVATITNAEYWARLEGDQFLAGRGLWNVSLGGTAPAILPLGPLSLSIRDARWRSMDSQPARHGAWGQRGSAATVYGLDVTQTDTLEFGWRARVRATPAGIEIPWNVPAAVSARLVLELPAGMEPSLDGGLVLEAPVNGSAVETPGQIEAGFVRWTLAAGPGSRSMLRIRYTRPHAVVEQPQVAVREELAYRVGERGVDLTATFHVDEPPAAGRELTFRLPNGLRLMSVAVDEREVAWRITEREDAEGLHVEIQWPAASRATSIVLKAWRELVLDEAWKLPKLQAEESEWTSGSVELVIEPSLEVRGLVPSDCVQTRVALTDASRATPEAFSFAAYSAAANVEVTLSHPRAPATVRQAQTLTVGDPDVSGRLAARLAVASGSKYSLTGVLQAGWIVESVETIPADDLHEWFVEGHDDSRRLVVQFARGLAPDHPLSVVVNGRLQRSAIGEPLAADGVRMVAWNEVDIEEHWVQMRMAPPLVIESTGLRAISAADLSVDDGKLFGDPPEGTLYDLARPSGNARLRLAAAADQLSNDGANTAKDGKKGGRRGAAERPQARNLRGSAEDGERSAIVRWIEMTSSYSVSGRAAHRVRYELENRGAANFELKLADGVRLDSVEVDGEPVTLARPEVQAPFVVPLPRSARYVTVIVAASSDGGRLAAGRELSPPVLDGMTPPLAGEWSVGLPDEFAIDDSNAGSGLKGFDWRERLLGPLAARGSSVESRAPDGWQQYRVSFVACGPRPIVVTRPSAAFAWAISLCLLCLAGGGRLFRWRREVFIALLGSAAALWLIMPASYAPLAAGSLFGFVFSLCTVWPRRESVDETVTKTWPPRLAVGTASLAGLALFLVHASAAQIETGEKAAVDTGVVHRVLIPINKDGQVEGSKYFVGERLLGELLRRAQDGRAADGRWLLRGAEYQFNLHEQPARPGIIASGCSMALDIEVTARDAAIELPLVRGEAEWGGATLDGVPCAIDWTGGGRSCRIVAREPGRYELKLSFVPKVGQSASQGEIGLSIPPLAGSTIHVRHPKALAGLTTSAARDLSIGKLPPGELRAELDESGRLAIRWPRQDVFTTEAQNLQVAELKWLHVSAEDVVVDVKYVVTGPNRPEAFTLVADSRWQPVTDGESLVDVQVDEESNGHRSMQIGLPPAAGERCEAVVRFRLQGAALPGNLRLPMIQPASLPVGQRWLAVSSAADFDCEIAQSGKSATRTGVEFLSAWNGKNGRTNVAGGTLGENSEVGETPHSASAADQLTGGAWRVVVRPRRLEMSSDESLQVAAGSDRLRVQYRATIVPGQSEQFQLDLAVPAEMAIDQVAVSQAGVAMPLRWTRRTDREVQIFFGDKLTEAYRLVLTGHTTATPGDRLPIPCVAIVGHEAPARVWLYREAGVIVEPQGAVERLAAQGLSNEPPLAEWNVQPAGYFQIAREPADAAWLMTKAVPFGARSETSDPKVAANAANDGLAEKPKPVNELAVTVGRRGAAVRLADTVVLAGIANGRVLSTRFALVASGVDNCELELPAGQELAAINLDGKPALARKLAARRWEVTLGLSGVPQILEVVTQTLGEAGSATGVELSRPTLYVDGVAVPVELSLWMIGRPRGGEPRNIVGASPVAAVDQAALRIERMVSVVEAGLPVTVAISEEDRDAWLSTWEDQLDALRQRASSLAGAARGAVGASQVTALGDEPLQRAVQRIDAVLAKCEQLRVSGQKRGRQGEGKRGRLDGRRSAGVSAVARWDDAAYEWSNWVADGAAEKLKVEPVHSISAAQTRAVGLLAICLLTVGAVWVSRRIGAREAL